VIAVPTQCSFKKDRMTHGDVIDVQMWKQATHDLLPENFQADACVIQSDDQQNTPGLDPLPLPPARQKGQYEMIDTVRTRRHNNADAAHRTQQVVFDMKMHRHA